MSLSPQKLLIADDHQIIIDGIRSMLTGSNDYEIVAKANNGKEVLNILKQGMEIDIAILDLKMPEMDGIETLKVIRSDYPQVKVLVLTMFNELDRIDAVTDAGGHGYVLKNAGKAEFLEALKRITHNQLYFSPEVTHTIIASRKEPQNKRLTSRETEVLKLIGECLTSGEISAQLKIEISTVETHRRNLIEKLDVRGTMGLVRYAVENGFVS